MKSDDQNQAKTDLLRELESLRAQLDDPNAAELHEEDIPLLLDRVEKVVTSTSDNLAEEGLDPDEIAALQAAYREATTDLEDAEIRLVDDAFQRLKEDREAIERVTGEPWTQEETSEAQQQSLFSSPQTDAQPSSAAPHDEVQNQPTPIDAQSPLVAQRPVPLGENPFLPKHIRDRLQERRRLLEDDIAQAASFFPAGKRAPATTNRHPPLTSGESRDEKKGEPDAAALVDALVAKYLPKIEAELRAQLMRRLNESDAPSNGRHD